MSESKQPIDPFWWCRHDERLARKFWEQVERPMLMAQFAKFDDPEFWKPKPQEPKK